MRLYDALMENPGTVKIGTEDGATFFYCGTSEDLLENETHYSIRFSKFTQNKLTNAERELTAKLEAEPSRRKYVVLGVDDRPTEEGFRGWCEIWFAGVRKAKNRVEKWQERIRTFVNLFQREVVDVRKATAYETDCTIIVIQGYEPGAFWTTDEANGCEMRFGGGGVNQ